LVKIPMSVRNIGSLSDTGLTLTVTLDSSLSYGYDTSGITPSVVGDTITWSLPDLGYLESHDFDLYVNTAVGPAESSYPVSLAISSNGADTSPTDNVYDLVVMIAHQTSLPIIVR
jgi:hypothetical protein